MDLIQNRESAAILVHLERYAVTLPKRNLETQRLVLTRTWCKDLLHTIRVTVTRETIVTTLAFVSHDIYA
jgi:hypothetical protein